MKMNIRQIVSPEIIKNRNEAHKQPIAFLGSGPASISCASFLARLGYTNLTIYEKEEYLGGLRWVFCVEFDIRPRTFSGPGSLETGHR